MVYAYLLNRVEVIFHAFNRNIFACLNALSLQYFGKSTLSFFTNQSILYIREGNKYLSHLGVWVTVHWCLLTLLGFSRSFLACFNYLKNNYNFNIYKWQSYQIHVLWVFKDFRGTVVNLFLSNNSISSFNLYKSLSILSISLPIASISLGGSPLAIAQSKCIYHY